MRLGKGLTELGQASPAFRMFQFFGAAALWVAGCFAISIQLFTRKGFGERYASIINCVLGIMAISLFSGLGNLFIAWVANEKFSVLMQWFYLSAIVLVIIHRMVIWHKNRKKIIWHSMYSGDSLLEFTGLPERFLKRWAEPIILISLAYFARHSHELAVGLWLEIGGISVFAHETLAEVMERADMLDRRDAWIESTYKQAVLAGTQRKDKGFSLAQSSVELIRQTPELVTEYSNDVKSILDRETV